MSEEMKEKDAPKELGFQQMMALLLRKGWLILLTGILTAVIVLAVTVCLIVPKYESTTVFYVNNGLSLGNVSMSLSSGDLSTRQKLVDSYIVILESREYLLEVIDYSGVDRSYSELQEMIAADSVNETEIFQVIVTGPDAAEAQRIAYAIEKTFPKRIETIVEGATAKVVDSPIVAEDSSSPNYALNTVVGFLMGLLFSIAAVVLHEVFDVTIRSEEDLIQSCACPVLAAVPDMLARPGGGYYDRGDSRKSAAAIGTDKGITLVGEGISFSASEAYKLLRTKLQFSFVDDRGCRVIGVSSAMAGEGKSLSSVNLAYSLAQLEKRVLLIDCDMRRPSLNAKLPIRKQPGLSNYLTRQVGRDEVLQKYTSGGCGFDVVSSGRTPPNPIELLSSRRMKDVLEQFREEYDYVILDLPPVGEVSDALAAAKLVDGILLIVRQDYSSRVALNEALNQFRFMDTRIFGVVLNCTTETGGRYGKSYKAYKRYGHRYEGSYMVAGKRPGRSGDQAMD